MKNKVLAALIGLALTLSMIFGILTGCTGGTTPKTTTPGTTTEAPTATVPGATTKAPTTTAPAPTKAGEVFKWRCQSNATAGSPKWWMYKELVENIKIASGGRLIIDLFPQGAILGVNEIFQGVTSGALECGLGPDTYWAPQDSRFDLNCMISAGFQPLVQICWFYYGNADDPKGIGMKYRDDLFGKFGTVAFPLDMAVSEAEYLANKPIVKASDYKGLTFRGAGWDMRVVPDPQFGAKAVFIAGADVYSALQTGVVDACELGSVYSNFQQGYNDITKYTGFPGIHNLCETYHFFVHKDQWKKLPDDVKKDVELACSYYSLRHMAHLNVECARVIPKLVEKGITITYQSPDAQKLWRDVSWRLADEEGAKYPEFKKMWADMKEFQYTMDRYFDLQTPNYGPDYPGRKETLKGIKY